jgi:hypothetical protein
MKNVRTVIAGEKKLLIQTKYNRAVQAFVWHTVFSIIKEAVSVSYA